VGIESLTYDLEYYESMLRRHSATAEKICKIRWEFISELSPKTVLDYGSGVGWFRAWRPEGVEVYTYDIAEYPQTGLELTTYDCVCFWDVLEHILNFRDIEPILRLTRHVAVTIPIKPEFKNYVGWKHFRPSEHVHYFTEETLDAMFESYGFEKMKSGMPECPPRQDVLSVIYKRTTWVM